MPKRVSPPDRTQRLRALAATTFAEQTRAGGRRNKSANFRVVQWSSTSSFRPLTREYGKRDAPLAQLAEQVTLNHWVSGSIPERCRFPGAVLALRLGWGNFFLQFSAAGIRRSNLQTG